MSPENTQFIVIGAIILVVALIAIWLFMRANRKTEIVGDEEKQDVLDEGAAPAQRNQALIDAPAAAEPLAKVPPTTPEAAPEPIAEPAPTTKPSTAGDDLTQIKGLGPKLATMLGDMGINSFAEIAGWNDSDIERVDAQLGRFQGRITRDQWVEQAKLLISEDKSAFEDKFGNNG